MALQSVIINGVKIVVQEAIQGMFSPTPLGDLTNQSSNDLYSSSEDKNRGGQLTQTRRIIEYRNNSAFPFYNANTDYFHEEKRTLPREPILASSNTINTYLEKPRLGLFKRLYGGCLYKIKPNQNFTYSSNYTDEKVLKDFYSSLIEESYENIEDIVNSKGEFTSSVTNSSFVQIQFPNSNVLLGIYGNKLLLKYYDLLKKRLKEVDNLPLLPEVVPEYVPPKTNEVQPIELLKDSQIQDFNKNIICFNKKLHEIHNMLGGEFFFKNRYNKHQKKIELKENEIAPDYFPAEDVLKNTILKQFADKEVTDLRYKKFNEKESFQQVRNIPDLITHLLAVFVYRLGLHEFPIEIPESFTAEDETDKKGNIKVEKNEHEFSQLKPFIIPTKKDAENRLKQYEKLKKKGTIEFDVQSLSELNSRLFLMVDELSGQYPIKIDIEENDLIKTDGKKVELSFPNQAETLKELIRLQIEQKAISDTNLKTSLRTLLESGNTKQIVYQNYNFLDTFLDFLGFGIKEKNGSLPMFYDLLAVKRNLDDNTTNDLPFTELLKDTQIKVPLIELNDNRNFTNDFNSLLESARIIKGKFWHPLSLKDGKKELLEQMKNWKKFLDSKGKTFEEFIENFESGFANKAQVDKPEKPFGKEKGNRPQIKIISKKEENKGK